MIPLRGAMLYDPRGPSGDGSDTVETDMMRIAAIAAAGGLSVLTGLPQAALAGPIERGRAIAEVRCGVCHAVGEAGESPLPQAPVFRELNRRYPVDSLEEGLAEGIVTGHAAMPEISLEPPELSDFLAYLNAIQTR